MAFAGRLHPLLIHFPIALVMVAALAEIAATVTAAAPEMDPSALLGTGAHKGGTCGTN
jgi:uncharacterized membrane protein